MASMIEAISLLIACIAIYITYLTHGYFKEIKDDLQKVLAVARADAGQFPMDEVLSGADVTDGQDTRDMRHEIVKGKKLEKEQFVVLDGFDPGSDNNARL